MEMGDVNDLLMIASLQPKNHEYFHHKWYKMQKQSWTSHQGDTYLFRSKPKANPFPWSFNPPYLAEEVVFVYEPVTIEAVVSFQMIRRSFSFDDSMNDKSFCLRMHKRHHVPQREAVIVIWSDSNKIPVSNKRKHAEPFGLEAEARLLVGKPL